MSVRRESLPSKPQPCTSEGRGNLQKSSTLHVWGDKHDAIKKHTPPLNPTRLTCYLSGRGSCTFPMTLEQFTAHIACPPGWASSPHSFHSLSLYRPLSSRQDISHRSHCDSHHRRTSQPHAPASRHKHRMRTMT